MPDFPLEVWFGAAVLLIVPFVWFSERKEKRKQAAFLENATITDGVVSRVNVVERMERGDFGNSYKAEIPIVRFRAANKIEYEFNAKGVGAVGTPVKVAYDPALPSSAVVVAKPHFQLGCAQILIGIAIILIILGYTT